MAVAGTRQSEVMYSLRLSLGQITIEMHHALQSLAALCITPICLKQHPVPDQMLKYQCQHLGLEVGTTSVTALLTFSLMSLPGQLGHDLDSAFIIIRRSKKRATSTQTSGLFHAAIISSDMVAWVTQPPLLGPSLTLRSSFSIALTNVPSSTQDNQVGRDTRLCASSGTSGCAR